MLRTHRASVTTQPHQNIRRVFGSEDTVNQADNPQNQIQHLLDAGRQEQDGAYRPKQEKVSSINTSEKHQHQQRHAITHRSAPFGHFVVPTELSQSQQLVCTRYDIYMKTYTKFHKDRHGKTLSQFTAE